MSLMVQDGEILNARGQGAMRAGTFVGQAGVADSSNVNRTVLNSRLMPNGGLPLVKSRS
jgi:hypothetical protein